MTHSLGVPRALRPGGLVLALTVCGGEIQPSPVAGAAAYRDPSLAPEGRVDDLLARMTLAEKIGQMTLVEENSIGPAEVADRFIGGVLSGGGGTPASNTPKGWADMVDGFQQAALGTPLGIPILYVRDRSERLIVVLVTGRPLILGEVLELADAVVVGWLPGSEGAGIADVLFGDVPFDGRLPYTWPESLAQLPLGAGGGDPLFPFGFGLTLEP